jgi:hypothetical protein
MFTSRRSIFSLKLLLTISATTVRAMYTIAVRHLMMLFTLIATNQFDLGFDWLAGHHYYGGYELWSGSGSGGIEYFPTDLC